MAVNMEGKRLSNNQLDIAILTYNRAPVLRLWLSHNLDKVFEYNIALTIFDGSTSDETKMLIEEINGRIGCNRIKYFYYDSNIRIDERAIDGILKSESEYVWLLGDSKELDFDEIIGKCKDGIDNHIDYVCIWDRSVEDKDGMVYEDSVLFLQECFWHATWLGGLIIKRDLFKPLYDNTVRNQFLAKYNRKDGFSYVGIFFELIGGAPSSKGLLISTRKIVELGILGKTKNPSWLPRYMDVWCGNLIYVIDSLPEIYDKAKTPALRRTWNKVKLDSYFWLSQARIKGGLDSEIFKKYDDNGMIGRVSTHRSRMRIFSYMPIWFSKLILTSLHIRKITIECAKTIIKR